MQFRKLPIVVDAVQFTEAMERGEEAPPEGVIAIGLMGGTDLLRPVLYPTHQYLVRTLEGDMTVSVGDWIITGVKGERYPCKPDIFALTYEAVKAPYVRALLPIVSEILVQYWDKDESWDPARKDPFPSVEAAAEYIQQVRSAHETLSTLLSFHEAPAEYRIIRLTWNEHGTPDGGVVITPPPAAPAERWRVQHQTEEGLWVNTWAHRPGDYTFDSHDAAEMNMLAQVNLCHEVWFRDLANWRIVAVPEVP